MIVLRQNNYGLVNKLLRNKEAGNIRELKRGLELSERKQLQDLVNNERRILGSGFTEDWKNKALVNNMNAKKAILDKTKLGKAELLKRATEAKKGLKK
jgi:hypothetical protein